MNEIAEMRCLIGYRPMNHIGAALTRSILASCNIKKRCPSVKKDSAFVM